MRDSYYATPRASCIHGSHAVDIAARRGRDGFPDTHLMACDLHCSGATAAWRAVLVMLHGVTGGPATSRGLEIWCPVYAGSTLQYCSQDNSRASTDRGSLTRYVRGAAAELLTLCLIICVYGCADPAVVIIRIRLVFGSTIRPNTNIAFSTIRCRTEYE